MKLSIILSTIFILTSCASKPNLNDKYQIHGKLKIFAKKYNPAKKNYYTDDITGTCYLFVNGKTGNDFSRDKINIEKNGNFSFSSNKKENYISEILCKTSSFLPLPNSRKVGFYFMKKRFLLFPKKKKSHTGKLTINWYVDGPKLTRQAGELATRALTGLSVTTKIYAKSFEVLHNKKRQENIQVILPYK